MKYVPRNVFNINIYKYIPCESQLTLQYPNSSKSPLFVANNRSSERQQLQLAAGAGIVLSKPQSGMSAERRILVKQFIKSFNVVLVALLMYNLWRHKWKKVNFN